VVESTAELVRAGPLAVGLVGEYRAGDPVEPARHVEHARETVSR